MAIMAPSLERLVSAVFTAAGCAVPEAECIARHLVDSNLCGHDSHGVIRVPRYIDMLGRGEVAAGRSLEVVFENPSILVGDGGMGFGQMICEQAMERLAAKAKTCGIALCGLKRTGHVGRLGDWAEQLARHDLVSLHFLNTTGRGMMAVPFGGSDRRLSLCPLAMCVPIRGRDPVLLDMTTTVVAEGKLAVARNKGEQVAPGTIVDRNGEATTDPEAFYDGGALLPIAGHKGSGLNILVDLLAGGLSTGGCTASGVNVLENCMTSIAIDPAPFAGTNAYVAELSRFADWVKGSPPRQPGGEVLLPGEFERNTRAQRRAEGIPLDATTLRQITETARAVGLADTDIDALAHM